MSKQYICLIYSDEAIQQNMAPAELGDYIGAYGTFTQSIIQSGNFPSPRPPRCGYATARPW